jgi:hypothetical protein
MVNDAYRKAIEIAADELCNLLKRQEELETELEHIQGRTAVLKTGLKGMFSVSGIDQKKEYPNLFPEDIASDKGFTQAVREMLFNHGPKFEFTAVMMRDELQGSGFDLSNYRNALASIHTILKRLHRSGEVETRVDDSTGKTYYSWKRGVGLKT